MAVKAKKTKAPAPTSGPQPRSDINGWVLCPGDNVLIVSPGEEHHGLFGKVDAFPTTLELSSYVQLDGRPSTSGRVLLPNSQLRWMGPDEERIELYRPTRPGQQVRVVLENEALATPEMKSLEGKLGTVTELSPTTNDLSMVTVKFDDPELAQWPTSINSYDLLVVPIPVVQYVPEPEAEHPAIQEESDLPFLNEQAHAEMRNIALADIIVTSNTRKIFDETALAELANSIKAQGVIAPITVRPHATEAGKFELVAGERRYRASKLAEQVTIPAVIRSLTDREFLEIQLLENLQRVDVRPADEAQAFSKLLKNDFSAEEVALKVGKPVKFVLQRAKLSSLIPNWFEKLENGTLDLAAAHELARLPVHSQLVVWRKADEEIKANVWKAPNALTDTFKKSYVRDLIEEEVLRDLSTAIWPLDDATLDLSAGACTQCTKRSSCQGLLFAVKDPDKDRCLDGVCFAGKRTKYLARRVREVTAELGTEPLRVSTYYLPDKKEGSEDILGTKDFHWSRVDMAGAVPAVLMDGNDIGQLRYVLLRQVFSGSGSGNTTTKEERAASMRNTRTKRVTNELLASDLRDLFAQSLPSGGTAANALLNHFLNHALTFGYSRIPTDTLTYLVAAHGWAAPSEQDLNSSYVGPAQPSGHQQYISRELDAMPSVLAKVVLYFDLKKFRNGLEQKEPTHAQRNLLAALPKEMQQSLAIEERAAATVDERYYTKKGKQKEVAA